MKNRVHAEAFQKDLDILYDLYKSRLLVVEQIARRHGYTKGSMYHKLGRLRKRGYISTQNIKGFSSQGGLQGKCYRITDVGINFLREQGYDIEITASALRVSDMRVPTLITTNDLFEEFSSQGWETLDSRELKVNYNLNRGLNLHGMLSSPNLSSQDGELSSQGFDQRNYPFYILLEGTSDDFIKRIRGEVERLQQFSDLIFFTKNVEVFQRTFSEMLMNADVFTYRSFRILPYGYGVRYLIYYDNFQVLLNYLEDRFNIYEVFKSDSEYYQNYFETVVEYEGDEYYLVNMLDYNLTNLYHIRNYTNERYKEDGRKVLLLSDSKRNVNYQKILEGIGHVEYLYVDVEDLMNYPVY